MHEFMKIQNTALRIATGCTQDKNTQHLHTETKTLPLKQHLKLHASQYRQKAQHSEHPSHQLTIQAANPRHMKQTTFQNNNNNYTHNIYTTPEDTTTETI